MTDLHHASLDLKAPSDRPLFFATESGLPLYGVFYPARHCRKVSAVVVFCNSLGLDQKANWRTEVLGARAVAEFGLPAFSYHPRGHGDSTSSFADVTLQSLVEDALAAADFARGLCGASQVIWIAFRFGALIAAEAIARRTDAMALALWEPVHRGDDYVHGLLRRALFFEVANGRQPGFTVSRLVERLEREGEIAVPAEWIHRTFYRSVLQTNLSRALAGWKRPLLLAQIQKRRRPSPDNLALAAALERGGARVTTACIDEELLWANPWSSSWVSARLIRETSTRLMRETLGWLDGMA